MNFTNTIVSLTLASTASIALAGLPNAHTWPMEHIMISMDANNGLHAHVMTDASNPVEMRRFEGETYDANASALNNQYYSDQYGWALDGIVNPGLGNSIWIEITSQSAGLSTYDGGMRMMIPMQTFDPIWGTAGSEPIWQWDGMMQHNWYSAAELGDYEASYRVYIGDSMGVEAAGFTDTNVTLNFRAVPSPSGLAMLGMGTLIATRRKRA